MKRIRLFFVFLLSISSFSLLLSSCDEIFKEYSDDDLHSSDCVVDIALEYKKLDFSPQPAKFYMVFLDRSVRFSDYYEDSLDLVYSSLAPILSSNDRVILAWMDFNNFDNPDIMDPLKSIYFDETLDFVAQPILPTPINTPILMPTLTPGPGSVGKNVSIATSVWVQEMNKTPEAKYHCQIGQANVESEQIYSNWQLEQAQEKQEFLDELKESLSNAKSSPLAPGKYVYDSFSLASQIFTEEIKNDEYDEYVLIFFSDMFEWRPQDKRPAGYSVLGLKDVRVVVAMPNCSYALVQEDCDNTRARWEREFSENTFPLKFMTNFKSKPNQLVDFIATLPKP